MASASGSYNVFGYVYALHSPKRSDNGVAERDDLPVLLADQGIVLSKDPVMALFDCYGIACQVINERLTLHI